MPLSPDSGMGVYARVPADLTGPLPERFEISFYAAPARTTVEPTPATVTWAELVDLCSHHEPRLTKNGRGLSGAKLKPGTTRKNENVEAVSIFFGDVDGITTDRYAELRERLMDAGLAFLVYSTFKSDEVELRLRFAIPLAEPITVADWSDAWDAINAHLFDGLIDVQTKDISRMSYMPAARPDAVTLAEHHDGQALDWRKLPPAPARPAASANGTSHGEDVGIGRATLEFIAMGAPIGHQRRAALAATRSLLAAGKSVEDAAALVWKGMQASPVGDADDPWTYEDALHFAEDLAGREPTKLKDWPGLALNDEGGKGYFSPKDTVVGRAKLKGRIHTTYADGRVTVEPAEPASPNGHATSEPSANETTTDTPADEASGDTPSIDASVQDLRVITPQAWSAICQANLARPSLFRHGGVPVRVERDDEGRPILRELTLDHIRHTLARVAEFYTEKVERRQRVRKVVLPPVHVCKDVLATPNAPLPVVTRVTECPVFSADGELQTTPGYDAGSRTYLAIPADLVIPPVPSAPSSEDVRRARTLIVDEMLGDFPFVSHSDRANIIAGGLEPFVRGMIAGPLPLHGIEAPVPGSGKGLLTEAILRPSCGRNVGAIAQAESEEEWRKRLTSVLLRGFPAVQIDNVNRPLESGSLSMVLTIPTWTDRILGQTRTVSIPVRCSWFVTANNPTFSTEMARRTVRTRIDPRCDRPQDRGGWRHPELLAWIDDRRGELIWAFCVLVRTYVTAGRPKFSGKALGSYERWSHVIGGILEHVGIPGFLDNQGDFYDLADVEAAVWRAFVASWWDKFQDQVVGTNELFPIAVDTDGLDLGTGNERSQKTKFGKALGQQRDRVISGYRVTYVGEVRRAGRWRLLRVNVENVDERSGLTSHAHESGERSESTGPEGETFTDVHNVHTDPAEGDGASATPSCFGCGGVVDTGGLMCSSCTEGDEWPRKSWPTRPRPA